MVELEKNNGGQDKYEYYIRQENSQNSWTILRRQGETGKLYGSSLTDQLNQLKTQKDNTADPQKQVIINAVGGTLGGLVVAGALVALAKIFWPAIVASFAAL
ncbi:hypothetical protein BEWA_049100 [Theileria equi strain WA]|uniref:Uncharacterized protein n=1 Tax=Theileria equi strain WA TaxID=1537102 RepID=L1LBA5_THEEQ|nr:hypothetical protein BEWA_049100 [Theileria equi strain WA]EKX72443.1 hypothetical protein BEWA_049100 [Theileria equi strain WA]|eukprot:XP_004831895.1 hypothetical protein BEWA_049100 [Theileria equi strain WA]